MAVTSSSGGIEKVIDWIASSHGATVPASTTAAGTQPHSKQIAEAR